MSTLERRELQRKLRTIHAKLGPMLDQAEGIGDIDVAGLMIRMRLLQSEAVVLLEGKIKATRDGRGSHDRRKR